MDVQHHTTPTPSGHENLNHHHGVHLCHRCGWPFPKPHPSAKHRRAHKKICGTIEGYTTLIGSDAVSDDDDDDVKQETPSPKIGKKTSIGGSFNRSEDELFSDAVTEFAESGTGDGSTKKTLDRDLFYSFTDADNAVDTGIQVSEMKGPHVEKIEEADEIGDSSESNLELNRTGGLVKNAVVEPAPKPVSKSQEAKSVDVVEAGEDKGQESQASVTIPEKAKDSDITKMVPEVSAIVGGNPDNVEQEKVEKLESVTADGISEETKQEVKSDSEHVSEVGKESETVETVIEKSAPGCEIVPEVVKGSENDQLSPVSEEIKHEKLESDHKHVLEVAKESEIEQDISVLTEKVDHGAPNEQIQEAFEEPVAVLTLKTDVEEPELEKGSREEIEEAVKEPVAVVIEKADNEGIPLDKQSNDHAHEVLEKHDSILTAKVLGTPELEGGAEEQIQEVAKEADTVLTEKDDFGGPHLEKQSNQHTDEVVEKRDSVLTEKQNLDAHELEGNSKEQIQEVVTEPVTVLTEKEDLGGPHLETQSNEHVDEVVKKPDSVLIEKKDLDAPELAGSLKEQFQEVVKEPDTVSIEKEDLGPYLEKQSNEHTDEVVENPDSISMEKQEVGAAELEKHAKEYIFEEPVSALTEKDNLGVLKSETTSKDQVIEPIANVNRNLIADVSTETVVEEGNGKLMNNQDSAADLAVDSSSHNSLEGTWGSVSVLSTASIDAESSQLTEKSKANPGKSNTATSDAYEPPSFMTLVEPEIKDKKSEVQDSQPPPNSEASQAGWFPTLTKVNNESDGRKRNEEAMAKVTNWNADKQSTPLKNLLGEAKSPSGKQPDPVVQKDEDVVKPPVNDDVSSPPKLIEDDKKGGKKVKGRSLWVPFACCSSVNAVK